MSTTMKKVHIILQLAMSMHIPNMSAWIAVSIVWFITMKKRSPDKVWRSYFPLCSYS